MPDDLDIKNLRTYEEDIKNALDDGNVTTTDIVMAEQKKRQSSITAENARPKDKLFAEAAASKPKSMPMIFAGLALLVIGGGAIYYGMTFGVPFMNNSDGQNVRVTPTEDVLRSDKTISINTTNKTLSGFEQIQYINHSLHKFISVFIIANSSSE